MMLSKINAGVIAAMVGLTTAQESGWLPNQVNATMCQWIEPRVGTIRDTLYVDGGYLYWQPGLSDGTYGTATEDGNPYGLVYSLNFSRPFNTSMNASQLFGSISKAPNGGSANNLAPNYYDGVMFTNDEEWYTYGGVLSESENLSSPDADATLGYEAYWYGAADKKFSPGFVSGKLSDNVTRYVTAGAGVSVPSENLAFYFSGLRAKSSGPIYGNPASANETHNADELSTAFITLDMGTQEQEAWTNETLPTSVPGRANAELVWVPIGKRGILVAVGGVVDPVFATANLSLSTAQAATNAAQSLNFMTTVAVYDIENKQWYMQPTNSGNPPPLTQGCTVVASSSDYTSHNIYWYGGFDGINPAKSFNDDVWILSIPSFMWMRVLQGTNGHGRAGHKCVKPYPDQMMVIGGYTPNSDSKRSCVGGGIIQLFNLSSTEWLDSYNPAIWSGYSVPGMIFNMIGGTGLGGSNTFPPSWANQSMATLFTTAYNTSKLTHFYPYGANNAHFLGSTGSSSGLPSFAAPVIGVVVGLFAISCIIAAFIMYKRKNYIKAQGALASTSDASQYKVLNWMRGPPDLETPTVSSEESKSSFEVTEVKHDPAPVEAASIQIFEMPDNPRISEMGDTGMSYVPTSTFPSGRPNGLKSHPSIVSRSSKGSPIISPMTPQKSLSRHFDRTVSPISKPSTPSPESPPVGAFSNSQRINSGISSLSGSSSPPARLSSRPLSDPFTSDSEDDAPVNPTPLVPQSRKKSIAGIGNYISGPVSPPTPMRDEHDEYLAGVGAKRTAEEEAQLGGSPSRNARLMSGIESKGFGHHKRRKSVFGEMLNDE